MAGRFVEGVHAHVCTHTSRDAVYELFTFVVGLNELHFIYASFPLFVFLSFIFFSLNLPQFVIEEVH